MLCEANGCSCGITSSSLIITGSGASGDPWVVDTYAFSIVTSSTHPAGPSVGQFLWETDTGFVRAWDGVSWKLTSWTKAPACVVRTSAAVSVGYNSVGVVSFNTDDYDPFNWHDPASNPTRVTPTVAGWYNVNFVGYWQGASDYTRSLIGVYKNGLVPNTGFARRFDDENPSGFSAAGSSSWIPLNGTTDYIEMERYQVNNASASRTLFAVMSVEWKAEP